MKCDAHMRPFPNQTEVACRLEGNDHAEHSAILRDYAFHGSETEIRWFESDRRNYHGEWPGRCELDMRCILPNGHRGNHAS